MKKHRLTEGVFFFEKNKISHNRFEISIFNPIFVDKLTF